MIEFKKCYSTSDGQAFEDLEKAKLHEIELLVSSGTSVEWKDGPTQIANWLLDNAAKVVDVLTTTASSKLKARSVHGGKKVRTPKTQPQPQPATA